MCGDGNHQGYITDTSVTRRAVLLTAGAMAAAAGLPAPAFGEDAGAKPVTEKDVLVKTADGNADAGLFTPAGKGKWPSVLMWPDILGLRPVFREMGKRLAAQGYVVLVVNPYYRAKKAPVISGPFDFNSKADNDKLMVFRNGLTDAMVDRDSSAYVSFLDAQPQTDRRRKAAVQGFCFSGPLSFRTAAVRPDRIGAVSTFHPAALVTDKPSSPHLLNPKTRASFLVLIAKNDAERMPKEADTLKAAFAAAHRPAKVEVYPANHGWTVAGSQTYDEQQAERAWAELLPFLRTNVG
jgi:carboxymethylenebutenolidase